MHKAIKIIGGIFLALILIGILAGLAGYKTPATAQNGQEQADQKIQPAEPISKITALRMCNQKAKDCSEGIPAVETELNVVCFQLYNYTSDSNELLNYTETMC